MAFASRLFQTAARRRIAAGVFALGVTGVLTKRAFASDNKGALNPDAFVPFKVKDVQQVTHNTKLITLALPTKDAELGGTVASCLVVRAAIGEGEPVVRPYTPITLPETKGFFQLLIKEYSTGAMSKYLCGLKPGQTLEVKGPIPKLAYTANMKRHIGMVAGGTGITPMYQVLQEVAKAGDNTTVSLVYANVSPNDIMLRSELDRLQAITKGRVKVFYVVDNVPAGHSWKGGVGYITKSMLAEHLPPPSKDNLIFVCGPPGLMEHVSGNKNMKDWSQGELKGLLKQLGYTENQVYKF